MPLELPDLLFPCNAVGPFISEQTLEMHHGEHHRAYVDAVNTLVANAPLAGDSLERMAHASSQRVAVDPSMVALVKLGVARASRDSATPDHTVAQPASH